MAYSVSFNDNICQIESDYENLDDGEPGQLSLCQMVKEQAGSTQSFSETLQMEVLRERIGFRRRSGSCPIRISFMRDDEEEINPLLRHRWSAATVKILSSMPSRTTGQNSSTGIYRCATRSSRLHRHQTAYQHTSRHSRLIQDNFILTDVEEINAEEIEKEQLLSSLQGLSVSDSMRKLRAMPLVLADKMELRRLALSDVAESSFITRKVPYYSRLKLKISRTWRQWVYNCLPILASLRLWHSPMKRLSGRFGTGVLSYFLFLRTLLGLNFLLFVITGLFLVLPQAINSTLNGSHSSNTKIWVLTGKGPLSQSLIFYGYYFNNYANISFNSVNKTSQKLPYSIPVAYFFTITIAFFVICIILVSSMSKSYGKSFHVLKSNGGLAVKVFCFWDFNVSKKTSVRLQYEKISTKLKELLSEKKCGKDEESYIQGLCRICVHLSAWVTCLASISLCALVVNLHLETFSNRSPTENEQLLRSAAVSAINLLLPGLFNLSSWIEKYDSPSVRVYVSIFRNLLLKVSLIGVLCYHWLGKIAVEPVKHDGQCWETFVGQELYCLLVMDFIFTVLYTFLGEFLWRLFSKKVLKRNRKPVFDIARNVLELIYGQTLTWLGVLFAPLLPAIQIIKLFVLFYIKKNSVLLNCQASRKPWRATHMTTLFISLLFFPSFVGAATIVVYTIWMIKPSSGCGPFRDYDRMFASVSKWVQNVKNDHPVLTYLSWIYNYIVDNPLLLFLISGVFLVVIYIHNQVVDGQRGVISLLEKQIENEGKDKTFLINRLQEMNEPSSPISPHI